MNRSLRHHPRLSLMTIAVASLLVSACGGGGDSGSSGGGGGGGGGGVQLATNSITQANARSTAASALEVMDTLSAAGSLASDLPSTAKSTDPRDARVPGSRPAATRSFTRLAVDKTRLATSTTAMAACGSRPSSPIRSPAPAVAT